MSVIDKYMYQFGSVTGGLTPLKLTSERASRRDNMKKYKVTASQTIYATYEIEVDAENEQQAEKRALATSINDWDDERFENGDALDVDEIEEVQE